MYLIIQTHSHLLFHLPGITIWSINNPLKTIISDFSYRNEKLIFLRNLCI